MMIVTYSKIPSVSVPLRRYMSAAVVLLLLGLTANVNNNSSSSSSSNAILLFVSADFGDTVDTNFECPVFTTCPVVCVTDIALCPTRCEAGTRLCPNGSCSSSGCDKDHENQNPCPGNFDDIPQCGGLACPKKDDFHDSCFEAFDEYYTSMEECNEALNQAPLFNVKPLWLLGFWLVGLTVTVFLWCRCCGNYHPNATQTVDDGDDDDDDGGTAADQDVVKQHKTQTGYTTPLVGMLLYYAVLLTLFGFQVLLLVFTWASYYKNERESLIAFEVTWVIGFVWTFLFKWPSSIRAVFYRRCDLADATIVCINVPPPATTGKGPNNSNNVAVESSKSSRMAFLPLIAFRFIRCVVSAFSKVLGFFFNLPGGADAGKLYYIPIRRYDQNASLPGVPHNNHKYFVHSFRRYAFDDKEGKYVCGRLNVGKRIGSLQEVAANSKGLDSRSVLDRLERFGPNVIDMEQPKVWTCIHQEFSKPFYTYQTFILWTWMPLYYFYLALVHGSVIVVGGFTVAIFRYRNENNLYKLTHQEGYVNVLRDGHFVAVEHAHVVPGDVVQVTPGKLYTDMVLIKSEGLLVDESALTGESTPMPKTALDIESENAHSPYDPMLKHRKHSLSAGTTVLESEMDNNLAIVVATGSYTSKGKLLRDVFSYERHSFQFDREVGIVFLILIIESIIAFALVWNLIDDQHSVYAWFYGMYVVSTLLPPLLPTVFTVSVGISENRLSKANIASSNSEDILVAGKVTEAIFDKTGTLTRQGLDFVSARCRSSWETESTDIDKDMLLGMSCCHTITLSKKTGDLIGNPVDRTMFAASEAFFVDRDSGSEVLIEGADGVTTSVVRQFDFDHHRMTQSVICKLHDGSFVAFVKGSGESVQKLCTADSLPADLSSSIRDSAKSGTYQISLAKKLLTPGTDLSRISRDEVENDLSFVGLINFKNVLRNETAEVIRELEAGEVKCIMATGDSMLTGVAIAKECGIIKPGVKLVVCSEVPGHGDFQWIDESNESPTSLPPFDDLVSGAAGVELAVTGAVWEEILKRDSEKAAKLAQAIRVYGRCTPYHKVSVVSTFVEMGKITLMCGDGGNDCGALKIAHVGVALSDAEASIVSPFTSIDKSIESVVHIIREGRCALASAFASYKYIIIYGQIEAFNNVCNAYFLINFSEYCWVFMDGFWMVFMSFLLPFAKAAENLAASRPTASLLGPITMSSTCGILFLNVAFAIISLVVLFQQDWFQCRKWSNEDASNLSIIGDNYEAETLFLVTGLQYITTAMAYNFGYEFRQAWYKNRWFVVVSIFFIVLHIYVTFVPGTLSCVFRVNCENDNVLYSVANGVVLPIQNSFNTTVMPISYRWTLLVIMALNTICILIWDYYVVNGTRQRLGKRKRDQNATFVVKTNTQNSSGDVI